MSATSRIADAAYLVRLFAANETYFVGAYEAWCKDRRLAAMGLDSRNPPPVEPFVPA